MIPSRCSGLLGRLLGCWLGLMCAQSVQAMLLGIDQGSGQLYSVSTVDASLALIGSTSLELGSLEMSPDGRLYGVSTGAAPLMYELDASSAAASLIGPLGGALFVFEGGLAFAPDGTAYAANMGEETNDWLMTIDTASGQASAIAQMAGTHDMNGLAWRSDGMLIGLDSAANALVIIDPATGATAVLRDLSALNRNGASILGSNGGVTVSGNVGYFATAGTGATLPGSNELYRFDLFTGETHLVGAFPAGLSAKGIGGLAVPEPASSMLMLIAAVVLADRRLALGRSSAVWCSGDGSSGRCRAWPPT